MDNRLIFLYRVFRAITDGGTGKGKRTLALVVQGQHGRAGPRKIRGPHKPESGRQPASAGQSPIPCLREKPLGSGNAPVPKPTQVGR